MPLTDQSTFNVDSSKAVYLACPDGANVRVANNGNTLYYKSTSDVTSSSNDGSLATATGRSFANGVYLITAQGVSTSVLAKTFQGTPSVDNRSGQIITAPNSATTSGTDTFFASGTAFVGSVEVPSTFLATGIQYLVGSVGGTDKVIAILYDSAGNPLANSTTASSGTTAGTAAQIQQLAFTSPINVAGPGRYYLLVQANGGTAKLRTIPAHLQSGVLGATVSQTHGTIAQIAVPTTFTADQAPYAALY